MKRGVTVLACVSALAVAGYFAMAKWGIQHESREFYDAARQRPINVDIAVRKDYEMKANAGLWRLPVAVISNGNTVKNTEYSFLANVFAARGYLVASVQQDLPTDPPLVTKVGLPYVGRLDVYKKGEANILCVLNEMKKRHPNADYDHLTLVGHSNGGDTAMYFAKEHPNIVSQVVTLDNLRVPFVIRDKLKILSFRSDDPQFQTDPDVLPKQLGKKSGIDIIKTEFQHTWMSDRGPYTARERIQATLDKYLGGDATSELAPADTDNLIVTNGAAALP
ncbi:putative hydrolase [Bradyrhizobium sp. ORS 285]|uniref:alpha/beta hydrolase n=1 Tax=Bradyrhizobium sp. ORS 285 TaxID=115808 RepID=UPI0002406DC0|nr:alpha/beta hydrolase [Bradyrhizobium sp. ORS 285]CCD88465.1 putative hydrolase [Bradyrhizobium sp. ORS 285]SMX59611.1 putative hydrolase [Bradyrhizobium sp. ORS 285]